MLYGNPYIQQANPHASITQVIYTHVNLSSMPSILTIHTSQKSAMSTPSSGQTTSFQPIVPIQKSYTNYMKIPLVKTIQMDLLPSPTPELPKFDGAPGSDLISHIDAYATAYVEYLPYDDIMLKIILRTLTGEALKWFYRLPEESISTFQ